MNPDIRLFDDGTDPDDVRRGAFADSWLLSALSIISAASVGDGGVDEQVRRWYQWRCRRVWVPNREMPARLSFSSVLSHSFAGKPYRRLAPGIVLRRLQLASYFRVRVKYDVLCPPNPADERVHNI